MRRALFYFVFLIVFPPLAVLLLEGFLRLASLGEETGFFKKTFIDGNPYWIPNDGYTRRFFPKAVARAARPFKIPVVKAENARRIFVLGESAAMGDPDISVGISRQLEEMLAFKFPGLSAEVYNVALTAINSHVISDIFEDCLKREPDAFVFYMGNNEVVGPFGPGSIFGSFSPSLSFLRFQVWATRLRVVEFSKKMRDRFLTDPAKQIKEWKGMEFFLDQQISKTDPRLEQSTRFFKLHLASLIERGLRSGAHVFLCNVAVNLSDCAPFSSGRRKTLDASESRAWEQDFQSGKTALGEKDYPEALKAFEKALALDTTPAELWFQMGKTFLGLGENDKARQAFREARDQDTLRFRTDTPLNEAIASQKTRFQNPRFHFLDAVSLFEKESKTGIPGNNLFYEHVHFNFQGNYLLARGLYELFDPVIREDWNREASSLEFTPDLIRTKTGFTPWHELQTLEEVRWRLEHKPFTLQSNHEEQRSFLNGEKARLRAVVGNGEAILQSVLASFPRILQSGNFTFLENQARLLGAFGQFEKQAEVLKKMEGLMPFALSLKVDLGNACLNLKNWDRAQDYFEGALREDPENPSILGNLGLLHFSKGELETARRYYDQALSLNPAHRETRLNLGNLFFKQERWKEATASYLSALEADPRWMPGLTALALALLKDGKADEAKQIYEQILQIDPLATPAYLSLGELELQQKQWGQALACFEKGLEGNPDSAALHLGAGNAALYLKQPDKALSHLNEAKRCNPADPRILFKLGMACQENQQWEKAIRQFEEMLALDSGQWSAHNQLALIYSNPSGVTHFEKALDHAKTALSLNQEQNPLVLHTAARACAGLNRLEDALFYLDRAIACTGKNNEPEFYAYLLAFRNQLEPKK